MTERTQRSRGTLMSRLPAAERPRERLVNQGAQSLSVAELVAVLLGTGTRGESALAVADRVVTSVGNLAGLLDADIVELRHIPGVGVAKAVTIKAGIELGRRICSSASLEPQKIGSPDDAAAYLMDKLRFLRKEHFVTLLLDTKHRVIGEDVVSVGSLNASIVHPREIFRSALKKSAAAVICAHNHPSGDPTPSPEDVQVTERLVSAGSILGIPVLDHIVIGDKRYISMRERGLIAGSV